MKPMIVAKGVKLTGVLREHLARRLRFALDRTQHAIQAVVVRITDQNGPKGGIDKRCQIQLTLPGLPAIVVNGKAADITAAIDLAVRRAALAVVRTRSRSKAGDHIRVKDKTLAIAA